MIELTDLEKARFWAKVDKSGGPDACWPWTAGTYPDGYGAYRLGRPYRTRGAHRIAYTLLVGPIPDGEEVCHSCDNPPCCNGRHPWPGTHAQNMADSSDKGRAGMARKPEAAIRGDAHYSRTKPWLMARGDANGSRLHPERMERGVERYNARLDDDKVRAIRQRATEGAAAIARDMGVARETIRAVLSGRTWRHVS